ncbi:hypothetical protein FHS19_007047 [Paenibacillus rhizosphaerae]|uniref:Uncharacterized protein n=1 Tax=Paenibacillus rhizosphaerae TaxID=297318 RepID=A0A839TYF9_9BACL|nr:hypothetical protein [Paenibacillus rhizosphaerae]
MYVRIDRPIKNKMMEAPAEKIEEMMLKAHRQLMQKEVDQLINSLGT